MPFIELLLMLLHLYGLVVMVSVIMSWLIMFNVINTSHPFVQGLWRFCQTLTEPVLKHIRQIAKPVNGIDLSPVVLLIGIWLVERCIYWYVVIPMMRSPYP